MFGTLRSKNCTYTIIIIDNISTYLCNDDQLVLGARRDYYANTHHFLPHIRESKIQKRSLLPCNKSFFTNYAFVVSLYGWNNVGVVVVDADAVVAPAEPMGGEMGDGLFVAPPLLPPLLLLRL